MADSASDAFEVLTDNTSTTGASSEALNLGSDMRTVHVKGSTTAGSGAASLVVEVSNNTSWPWLTAATLSLTLGTTETTDGCAIQAGWKYMRVRLLTGMTGTGAKVSASIGV